MLLKQPTIVTTFYNIRKFEEPVIINKNENIKKIENYLELASKFILKLPYPLIIFVDPDDQYIIDYINKSRENYKKITFQRKIKLKDTEYYKYFDKLKSLQEEYKILNLNKIKDTPLYITLTNNKFYFLENSININPFKSSHFIWMDFGINHCAKESELIHEWIINIPDKIKQLCIIPFLEKDINYKNFFQNIHHHLASGIFSGSKENMLKYCNIFRDKTQQIYNEGWYQLEEAVMTIIYKENPELFDLYYGDYGGIISNYVEVKHDIHIVVDKIINKCIKYDNKELAFNIILSAMNYFCNNINSIYIYEFVKQNIIIDLYFTENKLLPKIIYLINKKILNNDENMKTLLKNYSEKLNYYDNKSLIIYFE